MVWSRMRKAVPQHPTWFFLHPPSLAIQYVRRVLLPQMLTSSSHSSIFHGRPVSANDSIFASLLKRPRENCMCKGAGVTFFNILCTRSQSAVASCLTDIYSLSFATLILEGHKWRFSSLKKKLQSNTEATGRHPLQKQQRWRKTQRLSPQEWAMQMHTNSLWRQLVQPKLLVQGRRKTQVTGDCPSPCSKKYFTTTQIHLSLFICLLFTMSRPEDC